MRHDIQTKIAYDDRGVVLVMYSPCMWCSVEVVGFRWSGEDLRWLYLESRTSDLDLWKSYSGLSPGHQNEAKLTDHGLP